MRPTTNRHAEQTAWATATFSFHTNWVLFVQNEWPCTVCRDHFRNVSRQGYSVVFLIVPPTGQYGNEYTVQTPQGSRHPSIDEEATLVFINGQLTVQLGHVRPNGCPALPKF